MNFLLKNDSYNTPCLQMSAWWYRLLHVCR